jgi:hypothetical protein
MLIEDIRTPVLLFAMDSILTASVDTVGALSVQNSKVLEQEVAKKLEQVKASEAADIYQLLTRVAIPINDRLMPIHYAGGTASQSHFVDYLDTNAVMTKQANIVTLRFELKNSLSALATVADLILGMATKDFFSSNEPRVSFFSANLCVYNAYLRGISRSIVTDTDREMLSITLEIAPNKSPIPVEVEKPVVTNSLENTVVIPPAISSQDTGDFAQVLQADIDYSFNWYQLYTVEEIDAIEVPDFYSTFTVERETIRLLRVNSVDFLEQKRQLITVEFKGVYITLKDQEGTSVKPPYSLMMYNNNLYFGIKNEN